MRRWQAKAEGIFVREWRGGWPGLPRVSERLSHVSAIDFFFFAVARATSLCSLCVHDCLRRAIDPKSWPLVGKLFLKSWPLQLIAVDARSELQARALSHLLRPLIHTFYSGVGSTKVFRSMAVLAREKFWTRCHGRRKLTMASAA